MQCKLLLVCDFSKFHGSCTRKSTENAREAHSRLCRYEETHILLHATRWQGRNTDTDHNLSIHQRYLHPPSPQPSISPCPHSSVTFRPHSHPHLAGSPGQAAHCSGPVGVALGWQHTDELHRHGTTYPRHPPHHVSVLVTQLLGQHARSGGSAHTPARSRDAGYIPTAPPVMVHAARILDGLMDPLRMCAHRETVLACILRTHKDMSLYP